jgi:anti-sigma factor (TIGR02949 family)
MSEERVNCREALEQLQDYLHQEATPDLARKIERHLEVCAPCLHHAQFERNFQALLGATTAEIRCPEALRQRIRDALRGVDE